MNDLKSVLGDSLILIVGTGYSDIIVNDPKRFIREIYSSKYYISEILWWERIELSRASDSLGGGGPRDPRDAKYFFSETDFVKTFSIFTPYNEYEFYMDKMQKRYPDHDLYPSFSLSLQNTDDASPCPSQNPDEGETT